MGHDAVFSGLQTLAGKQYQHSHYSCKYAHFALFYKSLWATAIFDHVSGHEQNKVEKLWCKLMNKITLSFTTLRRWFLASSPKSNIKPALSKKKVMSYFLARSKLYDFM